MFRVVASPNIRSANNSIYSIWYLSHRYCYLPLSWKSWKCAVGGLRHPQHTQTGSNSSMIAADSNNGVTNTRSCRYSCLPSWLWVIVPPETCRAVSRQNKLVTLHLVGYKLEYYHRYFFVALQPHASQGLHVHEVSSHTQRCTQSVGLLWTSDQLVADTPTWQYTTLTTDTDFHVLGGIQTHNLSRQASADLRLRPRGHWDRLIADIQKILRYWWLRKHHIPHTYFNWTALINCYCSSSLWCATNTTAVTFVLLHKRK